MPVTQGTGITRNRERLACVECRRRKLRCDRHSPCSACVRRGDGNHCAYQRFANGGPDKDRDTQARLESRLQHLEELVRRVAHQSESSVSSDQIAAGTRNGDQGFSIGNPSYIDAFERGSNDLGVSSTSQNGISSGATHWSSVRQDIQELRLAIADDPVEESSPPELTGADPRKAPAISILFGSAVPLTLKQVLDTYLPPRQELDRYISAYFKAPAVSASFLHAVKFKREYAELLSDPVNGNPLKLSMIFSICHIAKNALKAGRQGAIRDNRLLAGAAHCLVIGKYFRPKRYALESLLIHLQSLCLADNILSPDVAPLCGVLCQIASQMGYHRDPATLGLTPFESEMRRRIWCMFVQLNLLVSFHLGIPSAIRDALDMVEPPRNLYDSDFDIDSIEVPPSRPLEEPTGMQFCLAKYSFMVVFDKILRHALCSQQKGAALDKVDELHAELQSVYDCLPDLLKPRLMSESVFDHQNLIVTRLCVMFVYCKCLCVLHRPYVLQRREESIKACYDASMMLMRGVCDAYYEFTPEGQVREEGWFLASLTWHDFLMGAVSLCLSSLIGVQGPSRELIDVAAATEVLSKGVSVCISQGDSRGPETWRVQIIMEATMQRLKISPTDELGDRISGSAIPNGEAGSFRYEWNDQSPAPEYMEDTLWDGYLGDYLHLDLEIPDSL